VSSDDAHRDDEGWDAATSGGEDRGDPSLEGERLQKLLARAGAAPSRRKAEALIEAGRVTVDGRIARLGQRARPGADVRLDGRPVARPRVGTVLLLHKPAGVVTTAHDPQGRPTVFSLVPDLPGLHPVGRLDLDSEGLLLLTDDGELTQRLTHPRFEHRKRYRAWCREGTLSATAAARLRRGVRLEDGMARADRIEPAPGGCEIALHEGRKRQVRRMLAAVGYRVERLVRTDVAGIELGGLPVGAWREATPEELRALGYAPDT
jgi:23S rRNA pseudouridine2605 synthase